MAWYDEAIFYHIYPLGMITGGLFGGHTSVNNGYITVTVKANSGEIWLPVYSLDEEVKPIEIKIEETKPIIFEKTAEPETPAEDDVKTEKFIANNKSKTRAEIREYLHVVLFEFIWRYTHYFFKITIEG